MFGAPGEIRTPDQLVRSQLLYPAELRAHDLYYKCISTRESLIVSHIHQDASELISCAPANFCLIV